MSDAVLQRFCVPEIDIVVGAFSRRQPDPVAVQRWSVLVNARCLFFLGWIRQQALTMTSDPRQLHRLAHALAPFRDLRVMSDDHVRAAQRIQKLRVQGLALAPTQALVWAVVERYGGLIWTRQLRWMRLVEYGAPVSVDGRATTT